VRFEAEPDALWPALYRAGAPVQYSYLKEPLALWDVQTSWASRPWAMEPPCAGFALSWEALLDLRRGGVRFAWLTHGASLSSAGDASLDARLPWTERFDIPESTVAAVSRAGAEGRRVIAIGTTVVRALEGAAASDDSLQPGQGTTNLVIGPGFRPRIVSGILTGMHEPGDSHYRLLRAFAPEPLLAEAHRFADVAGFETHEFGDVAVVLPGLIPHPSASPTT
jgi:S-adenosylmethionine:tRNA ribosyltransferase-isomerase